MSSDQRDRPAVWGPVLIAALFLAVIGGSAGWALGHYRERAAADGAVGGGREPVVAQPGDEVTVGQDGVDQGGGGETHQPGTPAAEEPSPQECPRHTVELARERGAAGQVERVLYIKTSIAQVWICRDANDRLFYQGHEYDKAKHFREGWNSLFLATVTKNGDEYVATNTGSDPHWVYRVSRKGLWQGAGTADGPLYPASDVSF